MTTALTPQLPEGYRFVDQTWIDAEEIVSLRQASNWGTEHRIEVWQSVLEQSLASVGVSSDREGLVGIGFLAGNARHAVLCDLTVHPDHRKQGIGTAILLRRMEIAADLNVPYLYTELSPTNTIVPVYEALGFVAAGNAYTRASRRHPLE